MRDVRTRINIKAIFSYMYLTCYSFQYHIVGANFPINTITVNFSNIADTF